MLSNIVPRFRRLLNTDPGDARQLRTRQTAIVLAVVAAYVAGFFLVYPFAGDEAAALSVIPVMVIGWAGGLRFGLLFSPLVFLVDILLLRWVGGIEWSTLAQQGPPYLAALECAGTATGLLHDMRERLKAELIEHKRAEEALRDSEERLRATFEQAAVGIAHTHPDGHWLRVNQKLCDIVGYTRAELLQLSWADITYPDDIAADLVQAQQLLSGEISTYSMEKRYLRKDGSLVWVNITLSLVREPSGAPKYFIAVSEDITDRKQAREALQFVERRLRLTIEQTPAVLWTVDTELRFTSSAGAGLPALNLRPNEVVGKTLYEYFQTQDPTYLAIAAHCRALTGQPARYEMEWLANTYESYVEPLRDIDGRIVGCIGLAIDVTERKRAEKQQLELALEKERVELLREFINNISHDLKTPLSIINTSIYLLERLGDPQQQQQKLEVIKHQTQHLEKLIRDILTVSELGTVYLSAFAPVDLSTVIRHVEAAFRPLAEQKNLTLTLDLSSTMPGIPCAEEELTRAVVNLVENAIRYTPDGGAITIRALVQDDQAVVQVSDTGIGIAEADLPHIFEHFYRASNAMAVDASGTGLGLAIVKKTVEIHGGRVEAESRLGAGSVFRVFLPLNQVAEAAQ